MFGKNRLQDSRILRAARALNTVMNGIPLGFNIMTSHADQNLPVIGNQQKCNVSGASRPKAA